VAAGGRAGESAASPRRSGSGPDRLGAALEAHGLPPLSRRTPRTLQVNMGKWCNQTCRHCHVDAGPQRTERMARPTVERILAVVANSPSIRTVDITGGAPELNPHFPRLVNGALAGEREVIVRCNLTVLLQPGQQDTAEMFAVRGVTVMSSLPCYTAANTDAQRGDGVFAASIRALRRLNALGYGAAQGDGSVPGLRLHLVYNPLGPQLPPPQAALEADYRAHLRDEHGVVFDRLYTLTNMPIHRFADDLRRGGRLQAYEDMLAGAFNPAAVDGLMCRDLVSVDWDGRLSDCDFNLMLGMPPGARARTIFGVDDLGSLAGAPIATGDHCLGCTAGQGSSCGGALAGPAGGS
jgi:radical SAM/Cys-rich protein